MALAMRGSRHIAVRRPSSAAPQPAATGSRQGRRPRVDFAAAAASSLGVRGVEPFEGSGCCCCCCSFKSRAAFLSRFFCSWYSPPACFVLLFPREWSRSLPLRRSSSDAYIASIGDLDLDALLLMLWHLLRHPRLRARQQVLHRDVSFPTFRRLDLKRPSQGEFLHYLFFIH